MKRNRDSIGWKIQKYLILFVVGILALLWVLQVVFLDDFYRLIKTYEIRSLASTVQTQYEAGTLTDLTQDALNRETHIRIVNREGNMVMDTVGVAKPFIQIMDKNIYKQIFETATIDKGQFINIDKHKPKQGPGSMTYVLKLDAENMLLIQTQKMPVDATVQTIQIQLVIISILLIGIASILARLIYRRIAAPIIEINDSAKVLAKGDYSKAFIGSGYKEIEELSQTLDTMRHDLREVECLRNELLANVSHDLRTPLTMIGGYAELMKDIPEEFNTDNLDVIINETHYLKTMIQDMLDLSKIENGIETLNMEHFNLNVSIESLQKRLLISHPNRSIIVHVQARHHVFADKIKIEQALYNLLNNALTHSLGRVWIDTQIQDAHLRVTIRDEGEGIAEEDLALIWSRYYRSNHDHQRSQYGSGLGLSIVKNIFDLHGIEYGVKPIQPKGVSFWFKLNLTD